MKATVLFVDPEDAKRSEFPNTERMTIRVMSQLTPEPHEGSPRVSIGDLTDGYLVYAPLLEEVCLGTGYDPAKQDCEAWWIIASPRELIGAPPYLFRMFGPVIDTQLLMALHRQMTQLAPCAQTQSA